MCKIILAFDPLTPDLIERHRERVENGAGIARHIDGSFNLIKDMEHKKLYAKMERTVDTPFELFHSRLPSAGEVNEDNIQPFADKRILFCHNGTVNKRELMFALISMGVSFKATDSDSRLLFKLIQRTDIQTAVALLRNYDQNFILVNNAGRKIYIIGAFEYQMDKSRKYVLYARNMYAVDRTITVTDFSGKVLSQFITERYFRRSSSSNFIDESYQPSCSMDPEPEELPLKVIEVTPEPQKIDGETLIDALREPKVVIPKPKGDEFKKKWEDGKGPLD